LLSQDRANSSGRNEASSFPPQHLEFVSGDDGCASWTMLEPSSSDKMSIFIFQI